MRGPVLRRLASQTDAIIEQYRNGASFEELGQKYGCSWQTARRFLIACGEPLRPPVSKLKLDPFAAEVLAEFRSGQAVRALADKYHVGADTVRRLLIARHMGEHRLPGPPFSERAGQSGGV